MPKYSIAAVTIFAAVIVSALVYPTCKICKNVVLRDDSSTPLYAHQAGEAIEGANTHKKFVCSDRYIRSADMLRWSGFVSISPELASQNPQACFLKLTDVVDELSVMAITLRVRPLTFIPVDFLSSQSSVN
ncbi:MAG: hypothetical protein ASARMPRED_002935 [Alectoria sarmentosa]|nr:MAG: hypothetical protein ASARMPRED_002935 [Alectoria sarmentosa]